MAAQGHIDRSGVDRHIPIVLSVLLGVASFFAGLYPEPIKDIIESDWWHSAVRPALGLLALGATCVATWLIADAVHQRRRRTIITEHFEIRNADLSDELPHDQVVVGRRMRYLERPTKSRYLIVFLPGLGLDAGDFRRFMATTDHHTVALTLLGFNEDEAGNDRYHPTGLQAHVSLVSCLIRRIQRRHPRKRLILVGFSVGGDLILKLAELWQHHPLEAPKLHGALLLDPNINRSTMDISNAVACLDTSNPLEELKRMVQHTSSIVRFQNVCQYLYKITHKNLDRVKRYAEDLVAYWGEDETPDLFLERVSSLLKLEHNVRIVFSPDYDQQYNAVVAAAKARKMSVAYFHVADLDHFQLMDVDHLDRELSGLLPGHPAPR